MGRVKRISLGQFLRLHKTKPEIKDPIYCVLCSELRRSEQTFSPNSDIIVT